jgi:hypothetical protein
MALPVETLTQQGTTTPVAPSDPVWDAAFLRVESYLRAHHIESRVLLNQLATEIMRQTRALSGNLPADEVLGLAMKVAHTQIGQWFARIFPEGDWSDERFRARGRLALLLTDMPGRWSQHFLSPEPLPEELAEAMRTCAFQPGPELHFTNMPPTPAGLLFGDEADPERGARKWYSVILTRALIGGLLAAGLAGIAWAVLL